MTSLHPISSCTTDSGHMVLSGSRKTGTATLAYHTVTCGTVAQRHCHPAELFCAALHCLVLYCSKVHDSALLHDSTVAKCLDAQSKLMRAALQGEQEGEGRNAQCNVQNNTQYGIQFDVQYCADRFSPVGSHCPATK